MKKLKMVSPFYCRSITAVTRFFSAILVIILPNIHAAFSNVAENTVFFGDLLLRLPDITADILKRHKDWDLIIKWSVSFCNESSIFEKREIQLLGLVSDNIFEHYFLIIIN